MDMSIAGRRLGAGIATAALMVALAANGSAMAQSTELASTSTQGVKADGNVSNLRFHISADGQVAAFAADASNLVEDDTNGLRDIFIRDRQAGTTERVSIASDGTQADGMSSDPVLSADGRFVAFASFASNLVTGDTNGTWDIFVHDRWDGTTQRVSIDSLGAQAGSRSFSPAISGDGRFVAFLSRASNLVEGDTNGDEDVFVHDRLTGITERVSVAFDGAQADDDNFDPAISANGRFVVFDSPATNLVADDTNGTWDIFIRDRLTGTTERVSVDSSGNQTDGDSFDPAVSADGRFVTFDSYASDLVEGDANGAWDVFVRDRQEETTTRLSVGFDGAEADSDSFAPAPSAAGRFVTFYSIATNIVPGDSNGTWDVFVHDQQSGTTERASVSADGGQANDVSSRPAISADGRFVSFLSRSSNLSPLDTDTLSDLYVRDLGGSDNQPPIADAGPDRAVEASSAAGASLVLDASASTDPDPDDAMTYEWSGPFGTADGMTPSVTLAMGTSIVDLTVTDLAGASDGDNVSIVVADTTAPALAVPPDVKAAATGPQTEVEIGEAVATDLVDPDPVVVNDAPASFSPGTTLVTWTATDASGNSETVTQSVTVGFDFMGFKRPVRDLPTTNSVKAGRVILVRWSISDGNGGTISDPSVVESLQVAPALTCDASGDFGDATPARAVGSPKMESKAKRKGKSGQFVYRWKTSRDMRGGCQYLVLRLVDGSTHMALFEFK
jgi:Tol biopolymer transport system component